MSTILSRKIIIYLISEKEKHSSWLVFQGIKKKRFLGHVTWLVAGGHTDRKLKQNSWGPLAYDQGVVYMLMVTLVVTRRCCHTSYNWYEHFIEKDYDNQRLTCKHCGHESSEHKKHHTKKQTPSVVVSLASLVADAEIQKTNQDADCQMWYQP